MRGVMPGGERCVSVNFPKLRVSILMSKPKVLAADSLFDAARKILSEIWGMKYWARPKRPPREEVLRRVKDKEGLVCLLTEKVNDELLLAATKLKIAANVEIGRASCRERV